ncbi:MAG: transglycosylase SLT domain-containing protein [Mariprofundales bacterium]|nr:transglycosylase SLT domain-containing protein [Mariprofundales bacterium]
MRFILLLILTCLLPNIGVAREHDSHLTRQQSQFLAARIAIRHGDFAHARQLRRTLADYPLAPYIDIWLARTKLQHGNDRLVKSTLARYPDIPESWDLHLAWIKYLAKHGQWSMVDAEMRQSPQAETRMPKQAMLAAFHSGRHKLALTRFTRYWQTNQTIAYSLSPILFSWMKKGHPSQAERWQKALYLGKHRRWRAVRRQTKSLAVRDRKLLRRWRAGRRDVIKVVRNWPLQSTMSPHEKDIFTDLLQRLSRQDPLLGWQQLQRFSAVFTTQQRMHLEYSLALRAARHQLPQAAIWLAALPAETQNDATRSWRARLLLQQHDWAATQTTIAAMPLAQRQQSEWVYWRARALEQLGQPQLAQAAFTVLAKDRGYFSFLSAERLGLPYRLREAPSVVAKKEVDALANIAGIQRAHEWLRLGKKSKARREWYRALQHMDRSKWEAAGVLAAQWHWLDRAIFALTQGKAFDDLALRFPMGYSDQVQHASRASGLSPSIIWGIIRQESAFGVQARSPRGAMGLMQLMPRTARMVAKHHRLAKSSSRHLFDPAINIRIGSYYLASMQRRFDGNIALATAAYNAGPHRVRQWLRRQPYQDGAIWVASIPFTETRHYVQHVLAYAVVYDWRRGVVPVQISQRLGEPIRVAFVP